MQSAVLSLFVVALLISSAAAQACSTSASNCETCFNAGCSWAPLTVNANNQASATGVCYAQGQVPATSLAYASFVVTVQYCPLANCVGTLAASLINNGATGQNACNAYGAYFTCVSNSFCSTSGGASVCTTAFRNTYCNAYWSALSCSGSCPFASGSTTTTGGTVPSPTATKSLPADCFVTTLFNTFFTWTWNGGLSGGSLSTNALTWFTNFRVCLGQAASNYLQNNQQITCSNFQSALNDALRSCGNNANGASICGLSGAEIQSFISTNPLGNSTQVATTARLALANCPSSKYSEARFTFPNLSVSQLQALGSQIVQRICSILNINPCNRVTFVAAVQAKRQSGSATAVVGISADQGQDASVQVTTVIGQSQQVAQAAGTTTVAASTCAGQCSVSPASVATLAPVLLVALVVVVLVL
jgi:hypothetical protein